ncbi:MAG: TetR/AcrR family transcriptional regulator [Pseudomonadales bacterium]|nr:TetR/AcrR family transcriptional regulator [Pseudomonadales bacterium]
MRMTKKQSSGRVYGGLSKEERTAQRRQKFIDAGLEIFGTDGYQSATVRRLCREAGLTDRYYYESFASTEELLMAVYDQCMDQIKETLMEALSEAAPGADAVALIHRSLEAYFKFMEDERVARVVMLEVVGVSEAVDKLYNERMLVLADMFLALTRRVYPDFSISDEEGQLLGTSILGAMRQAVIHWFIQGYELKRETMVNTSAKLFLGLLELVEKESKQHQDRAKSTDE